MVHGYCAVPVFVEWNARDMPEGKGIEYTGKTGFSSNF